MKGKFIRRQQELIKKRKKVYCRAFDKAVRDIKDKKERIRKSKRGDGYAI